MDRGAWWATVHGVSKSQRQLSTLIKNFKAVFNTIISFQISYCLKIIKLFYSWFTPVSIQIDDFFVFDCYLTWGSFILKLYPTPFMHTCPRLGGAPGHRPHYWSSHPMWLQQSISSHGKYWMTATVPVPALLQRCSSVGQKIMLSFTRKARS